MAKGEWCCTTRTEIDSLYLGFVDDNRIHDEKKVILRKKIRCPKCGQRFTPLMSECHDPGCWHVYVPKHKERKKHKKWIRKDK